MKKNKLKNILIFIVIIILCIYGFKKITNMGSKFTSKDNLKVDCEHEWDNLNDKDKKIIKQWQSQIIHLQCRSRSIRF